MAAVSHGRGTPVSCRHSKFSTVCRWEEKEGERARALIAWKEEDKKRSKLARQAWITAATDEVCVCQTRPLIVISRPFIIIATIDCHPASIDDFLLLACSCLLESRVLSPGRRRTRSARSWHARPGSPPPLTRCVCVLRAPPQNSEILVMSIFASINRNFFAKRCVLEVFSSQNGLNLLKSLVVSISTSMYCHIMLSYSRLFELRPSLSSFIIRSAQSWFARPGSGPALTRCLCVRERGIEREGERERECACVPGMDQDRQ